MDLSRHGGGKKHTLVASGVRLCFHAFVADLLLYSIRDSTAGYRQRHNSQVTWTPTSAKRPRRARKLQATERDPARFVSPIPSPEQWAPPPLRATRGTGTDHPCGRGLRIGSRLGAWRPGHGQACAARSLSVSYVSGPAGYQVPSAQLHHTRDRHPAQNADAIFTHRRSRPKWCRLGRYLINKQSIP
jgi:hypothetical protein